MAGPTQDRAAVFDYLNRLGEELDISSGEAAASAGDGESLSTGALRERLHDLATTPGVDDSEIKSLENLVRTALRPIIRLEDDEPRLDDQMSGPWPELLAAHRLELRRAAAAVGRVALQGHPSLASIGSACHLGDGLVLTTRHNAQLFVDSSGAIQAGLKVSVDFASAPRSRSFAVSEMVLIHPHLDVALLRLEGEFGDLPRLLLDGCEQIEKDTPVAALGYAGASQVEPTGSLSSPLPAKLMSVGYVVRYEHATILSEQVWCLAHDCSTLPGFSGGPLVDQRTGHVLGVHFASQATAPGLLDGGGFAVPASELARDALIRALGIQFTSESPQPPPAPAGATEPVEPAAPPAEEAREPEASPGSRVTAVEQALRSRFGDDEDALVEFIESHGIDYARAVAAQPGRGRGEPDPYRQALVLGLERRGLITDNFLAELGLLEAAPKDPSADLPSESLAVPGDLLEEVRQLVKTLGLAQMPRQQQLDMLVGSPYWEIFTGKAERPPPLPKLMETLAGKKSDDARAALAWIINRVQGQDSVELAGGEPGLDLKLLAPGRWEMVELAYFRAGLEAARSVGRLVLPSAEGSTCWLIAPDLVVAPAHVAGFLERGRTLERAEIAKAFATGGIVVEFDNEDDTPTLRIGVREMVFSDDGLDIVVLRLKRRPTDRRPLQIRTDLVSSGSVASIHYPELRRKMASIHGGRLLANDGHEVKYLLATAPGVAGAPIFDESWQVVATHRARLPLRAGAGQPVLEGKLGTSVVALAQRLRNTPNAGPVWREIVSSQNALRTIDPKLREDKTDSPRQVMIELADADTKLGRIKGLRPLARLGRIVTATATPAAIQQLALRQGIISVEGGGEAAALECEHSIPYIGADLVRNTWAETGDQALVAIIDSGIDFHHETFLDEAGNSRILVFWDQQDPSSRSDQVSTTMSPEAEAFAARYGLRGGALYLASDIDSIRRGASTAPQSLANALQMDHGTVVCSIAAGRKTGGDAGDFAGGVAPGAQLIVIRYDLEGTSVGYSNGHIHALSFIDRLADDLGRPVVVNISNGMNSGAHDGRSKVEVACAAFCDYGQKPGRVIIKSAGNERQKNRHSEFTVPAGAKVDLRFFYEKQREHKFGTLAEERIEVWFPSTNQYEFALVSPSGERTPPLVSGSAELDEYLPNSNRVTAQYFSMRNENARSLLVVELRPGTAADIAPGTWTVEVIGLSVKTNDPLHAWIELNSRRAIQFIDNPAQACTITVPGTTEFVITVGAVELNPQYLVPYASSSMGPTLANLPKPDIVAPGVAIVGAGAGSQRLADGRPKNGTSVAAPHVAGTIALVLSAWQKARPAEMPNMTVIRHYLLNNAAAFNAAGHSQLGYGRLDAAAFFEASRPK